MPIFTGVSPRALRMKGEATCRAAAAAPPCRITRRLGLPGNSDDVMFRSLSVVFVGERPPEPRPHRQPDSAAHHHRYGKPPRTACNLPIEYRHRMHILP